MSTFSVYNLSRLRTTNDDIYKENGFILKKAKSKYITETITNADYPDDIAFLENTPAQAESLLHSLKQKTGNIGLDVNAKNVLMCFNREGATSTLNGEHLKLVDKFTNFSSSILSTDSDVNIRLTKEKTVINNLSIIWKYDIEQTSIK